MILTPDVQAEIDAMSYYTILKHRRFDPIGSEWWAGDVGIAMDKRFFELRKTTPEDEQVASSKQLGCRPDCNCDC